MIQEDGPWEVLYSSWLRDDSELRLYKYQNFHIENRTLFPRIQNRVLVAADVPRRPQKITETVTAEYSQALPHRKAVRKALACDFSPVSPTYKAFYLFDFTSSLLTNIKNDRLYAPRPTPRPSFILQKISSVVTQLPLIKPRLFLVFYALSPTIEDAFCPCPAFPRSPPRLA